MQAAMYIFTFLAVLCAAALGIILLRENRKTGIYDGIDNFRRHIDALTPDARRNVVARQIKNDDSGQSRSPRL